MKDTFPPDPGRPSGVRFRNFVSLLRRFDSVGNALARPSDFEAFRRQESALILLNLTILAILMLLKVLFLPVLGFPSRLILVLFAARFVEQAVEFLWLLGRSTPLSERATFWYARLSVWAHMAFACLVLLVGEGNATHYWALIALPVLAAGFRFSLAGVLFVALVGGSLDYIHLCLGCPEGMLSRSVEIFESLVLFLLLVVSGVVVWLLSSSLRREECRLRASLAALETAQKELIAKEKLAAIGRLAGSIAHEIRNPVGVIVGSLDLLRIEGLRNERRKEIFAMLQAESERLERLSGDFLTYARAREPQRRPSCPAATLDCVLELASARAEARGVRLRIEPPAAAAAELAFDPFQVHQALLNLTTNAIDAAPPGSEVVLRARTTPAGAVVFEVENPVETPPDENALDRWFEPFYTTKERGTGLGLCIARRIAEAHGGDLALSRATPERIVFALTLMGQAPRAD